MSREWIFPLNAYPVATEAVARVRDDIECRTGGKVSIAPEAIVGAGKTRATLHGGKLILLSVTVRGDPLQAVARLQEMAIEAMQ